MFINQLTIIIKAPVSDVWFALTDPRIVSQWLPSIKVISNWQVNSPITYTCYNEDGSVMEWEGNQMIWEGIITELNENQKFSCNYPNGEAGILSEDYIFEVIDQNTTQLTQIQEATSQEMANNYKEGNQASLEMLKDYLED
jgi:uncharacterized protein YndB with AHSA1/START domain